AGIDGTLREGRMPSPRERLRKVPLLRGLARLGLSLSPLFRRDGVAKPRERLLLVVAVAAPLMFAFLPHRASLIAGLALTLARAAEASSRRRARACLLPGLGLQRVTTREPRLEETRVALRAVESVLSRELSP